MKKNRLYKASAVWRFLAGQYKIAMLGCYIITNVTECGCVATCKLLEQWHNSPANK